VKLFNIITSSCDLLFVGALGDKEGGGGDDNEALQAEREHQQMLAELEQKRKEKHAKQEEEREEVRQSIRDKVSHFCSVWKISNS